MNVYIVTDYAAERRESDDIIIGVFETFELATEYVSSHPDGGYTIHERVLINLSATPKKKTTLDDVFTVFKAHGFEVQVKAIATTPGALPAVPKG